MNSITIVSTRYRKINVDTLTSNQRHSSAACAREKFPLPFIRKKATSVVVRARGMRENAGYFGLYAEAFNIHIPAACPRARFEYFSSLRLSAYIKTKSFVHSNRAPTNTRIRGDINHSQ